MRIRKAVESDISVFMAFKQRFPMPQDGNLSREGFLMGSSEEAYRHFVKNDEVWVLENDDGEPGGYAIVLRFESLLQSEIWKKRKEIDWGEFSLEDIERGPTCFYEQLALSPERRSRIYGSSLGFKCLARVMEDHEYSFTTVVSSPITNLASRRFVLGAGYQQVGTVTEDYPQMKSVVSDVFVMSKADFVSHINGRYGSQARKILGSNSF